MFVSTRFIPGLTAEMNTIVVSGRQWVIPTVLVRATLMPHYHFIKDVF